MSLVYKLWKIGSVLDEDDIKSAIREKPSFSGSDEENYLNINFTIKNQSITSITLDETGPSLDDFFFSKKIGGTSNAYYLYPNITVLNTKPIEKIGLLENTLKYCTIHFCNKDNKIIIEKILNEITDLKKKVKQCDNPELSKVLQLIAEKPKGNYVICLSVNGKNFFELMPEVWNNWYKNPVEKDKASKKGFDVFTNEETEIGYKSDFKVYSYDQYHDSLKHRLLENLPLSLESARNIKFAWIYILENLVFYYKGLEYVIIPNLVFDDKNIYKEILECFKKASKKTESKIPTIRKLKKEEELLKKKYNKAKNEEKRILEQKIAELESEINKVDLGMIQELNEQVQSIEYQEYINTITLDYIFTAINRTNLSFEIKGSIEDVIPSRMSTVVEQMRSYKIDDNVKLGRKDFEKTHLQDFFNRNELYFAVHKTSKNNSNSIFEERLYLAKLLLSDIKIKFDDLLHRFEFNRLYGYDHKKRLITDGNNKMQKWVVFPQSFMEKEKNILNFFQSIGKIAGLQLHQNQELLMEDSENISFRNFFYEERIKKEDSFKLFMLLPMQKAYLVGAYARAVIIHSYFSKVSIKNTSFQNWLSNQIINYRNLDKICEMAYRYERKLKLTLRNNSEVRDLAHEVPPHSSAGFSGAKISYAFVAGLGDYKKYLDKYPLKKDNENQPTNTTGE